MPEGLKSFDRLVVALLLVEHPGLGEPGHFLQHLRHFHLGRSVVDDADDEQRPVRVSLSVEDLGERVEGVCVSLGVGRDLLQQLLSRFVHSQGVEALGD